MRKQPIPTIPKMPRKYLCLFPEKMIARVRYGNEEGYKEPTIFPKKGRGKFVTSQYVVRKDLPVLPLVRVNCCGQRHVLELLPNMDLKLHHHESLDDLKMMAIFGDTRTHRCLVVAEQWAELRRGSRTYSNRKKIPRGLRIAYDFYVRKCGEVKLQESPITTLREFQPKPGKRFLPALTNRDRNRRLSDYRWKLKQQWYNRVGFRPDVSNHWWKEVYSKRMNLATKDGKPACISRSFHLYEETYVALMIIEAWPGAHEGEWVIVTKNKETNQWTVGDSHA